MCIFNKEAIEIHLSIIIKRHDYVDVGSLPCGNKISIFYIIRKAIYEHILKLGGGLFKIFTLITENGIGAFTRLKKFFSLKANRLNLP